MVFRWDNLETVAPMGGQELVVLCVCAEKPELLLSRLWARVCLAGEQLEQIKHAI